MILYLSATTNIPDVIIDYIMVKLKSGEEVSLNWDESDIARDPDGFHARYKGVYFNDTYANGKIDALDGLKVTDICLYYETDGVFHFRIDEMEFDDSGRELTITSTVIPSDCESMKALSELPLDTRVEAARHKTSPALQEGENEKAFER